MPRVTIPTETAMASFLVAGGVVAGDVAVVALGMAGGGWVWSGEGGDGDDDGVVGPTTSGFWWKKGRSGGGGESGGGGGGTSGGGVEPSGNKGWWRILRDDWLVMVALLMGKRDREMMRRREMDMEMWRGFMVSFDDYVVVVVVVG